MEYFRPTLTFDLYTSDLPSRIEALVAVMHTFRTTMITIHRTLSDRRHLLTTVSRTFSSPHASLNVITYNKWKKFDFSNNLHPCVRLTVTKRVYYSASTRPILYNVSRMYPSGRNYLLYFKETGGRVYVLFPTDVNVSFLEFCFFFHLLKHNKFQKTHTHTRRGLGTKTEIIVTGRNRPPVSVYIRALSVI